MIPGKRVLSGTNAGVPRVGGGDPAYSNKYGNEVRCSPRRRG